jgi:hypothetical protein
MELSQELIRFKQDIKEQWLEYCKKNERWLRRLMNENNDWISIKEEIEPELLEKLGGQWVTRIPTHYLIIGAIPLLDPSASSVLELMIEVSDDIERVIQSLGLNFDPFLELKRREFQQSSNNQY